MSTVTHEIDRIAVVFDDDNAVAAPGLLLAATLITRLRLESLINTTVKLRGAFPTTMRRFVAPTSRRCCGHHGRRR